MSTRAAPQAGALTVLIDDVRGFRDRRPARIARSSLEALALLEGLGRQRIGDLWLDHDLGGEDTIRPVVDLMVDLAEAGSPMNVGLVHIHTANVGAGHWMRTELAAAGYPVVRSHSLGMWIRER